MEYSKISYEDYYKKGSKKGCYEVVYSDGDIFYYKDGVIHRSEKPAAIYLNGMVEYYKEGELDRTDGPAVIFNDGMKIYYKGGDRHRTDGPAIIGCNGGVEYYLDDKDYSREDFIKELSDKQLARFLLNPENF